MKILLASFLILAEAIMTAPAFAACGPDSATAVTGDTVNCTGAGLPAFVAGSGVTNLTVNVQTSASITGIAQGTASNQFGSVPVDENSDANDSAGRRRPVLGEL